MEDRKRTLKERFKAHPHLHDRVYHILSVVEDSERKIDKVDEAEERVIEELRQLGQEVLENWAMNKEKRKGEELESALNREVKRHFKKNFTGIRRSEK